MEKYYKITKEEAELIGEFKYTECEGINPFAGEQEDGTFVISEELCELLKDNEQFKKLDFSKKELIDSEDLIPKETEDEIID